MKQSTHHHLSTALLPICGLLGIVWVLSQFQSAPKADELWARALWKSLPVNGGSSPEMMRLFAAALRETDAKAPIYVSLGDNASGALIFRERFDAALNGLVAAVGEELETEALARADEVMKTCSRGPIRFQGNCANCPGAWRHMVGRWLPPGGTQRRPRPSRRSETWVYSSFS